MIHRLDRAGPALARLHVCSGIFKAAARGEEFPLWRSSEEKLRLLIVKADTCEAAVQPSGAAALSAFYTPLMDAVMESASEGFRAARTSPLKAERVSLSAAEDFPAAS